jgi:hypothetical protein
MTDFDPLEVALDHAATTGDAITVSFDEAAQAVSTLAGGAPEATDAARATLRQVIANVGAAGAFSAATLRELGIEMDEARTILGERAGYIRRRWPQLSDDIVAYAVEHAMSNDDIAGALYMAATKKRSHQAHAQASRNWRPPSTGQKRSLKSKRR